MSTRKQTRRCYFNSSYLFTYILIKLSTFDVTPLRTLIFIKSIFLGTTPETDYPAIPATKNPLSGESGPTFYWFSSAFYSTRIEIIIRVP